VVYYVRNGGSQRISKKPERRTRKLPCACLLAFKQKDNRVMVTWSKCANDLGDHFSRQEAKHYAMLRLTGDIPVGKIPPEVGSKLDEFMNRAKRYFKGCEVVLVQDGQK
jgi:hypothetical protein